MNTRTLTHTHIVTSKHTHSHLSFLSLSDALLWSCWTLRRVTLITWRRSTLKSSPNWMLTISLNFQQEIGSMFGNISLLVSYHDGFLKVFFEISSYFFLSSFFGSDIKIKKSFFNDFFDISFLSLTCPDASGAGVHVEWWVHHFRFVFESVPLSSLL